jgi:hypothetical protein
MASILDRMRRDKMEIAALTAAGGVPHYYAVTPDQLTAVELTGEPAALSRLTIVGVMSAKHMAATSRNGAWASLILALALPDWKDGQKWLSGRIRSLRQANDVRLSKDGWAIHLTFVPHTGMMTLDLERG